MALYYHQVKTLAYGANGRGNVRETYWGQRS